MANKRIFYAIQQAGLAPLGVTTFTSAHTIHGLQTLGINTRFNLSQIFELGQLAIYQQVEALPNVEITLEKCLDGKALIYHLATRGAPAGTLVGRSNVRSSLGLSIFSDSNDSCSGMPIAECVCSGVYVSALSYQFPVEGPSRESVTLVGNNKLWITATGSITFTGQFDNTDIPTNWPPLGVAHRWHMIFGNTAQSGNGGNINPCVLPVDIDGIDGTGYNLLQADGSYGAHVQNIRVNVNLGRDELNELGLKAPFWRYVNFPVEVRCDVEVISTRGDMVSATEYGVLGNGVNLVERPIFISTKEGTKINLGNKNLLQSVTYGNANAGTRGGNATVTYSFVTFNDCTVIHPYDPTSALAG